MLLIGASTGGPQALTALVGELGPVIERVPVLITQHMPPTFTTILAEHLARASGRPGARGDRWRAVAPGTIYIAPGGRAHAVARRNGDRRSSPRRWPAGEFLQARGRSAVRLGRAGLGQRGVLAVILTGMGSDGTRGAQDIVAAGGSVIAQDEATSVVWGMPGAAAHAGVCSAVLPLDQIAPKIVRLFRGDRS